MASNVKNSNLIVGLDIGTSKVVCIVGKYNESNDLEIVALGSYPSSGLKKGVVVNIDATTDAISKAVEQAQSMIEDKIRSCFCWYCWQSHKESQFARSCWYKR